MIPASAVAENRLVPLDAVPERPYPYAILGTQPGDDLDEVMRVFTERTQAEPYGDTEVIRVTSPDGRAFEFTLDVWRNIGGPSRQGIIGQTNPDYPEAFRVELATGVLNGTPLVITRSMRQPTGELPDAAALRAQIEETYGPPSKIETEGGSVSLIYAWSDAGFIADLDAQAEREITHTQNGQEITGRYRPCTGNQAYRGDVEYRFQHPRQREIRPGCVAVFRVTHSGRPGQTTISFDLTDYELARLNTAETDRQIVEALTGAQEAEASDLDL
jgi:hypothetical protein